MNAKTFYNEFLRPFGVPAGYAIKELEVFWKAAFAAGREAMREDMIALVDPQMGVKQGEFGYSTMPRDIIAAIRAMPGKEG